MRSFVVIGIIGLLSGLAFAAEPRPAPGVNVAAEPLGTRLKLEECVAIALANHPSLAEASARIDVARGQVIQARLYPNPRVDSGNPQTIGPAKTSVFTVGLTQEIVRGGKLKLDQAAAFEVSRQSEWDAVRQRFEILTIVRQEFFSTLAAQRRMTLLEKQQQIAKRSESIAELKFKGGEASGADLLSLRVELPGGGDELAKVLGTGQRLFTALGHLGGDQPGLAEHELGRRGGVRCSGGELHQPIEQRAQGDQPLDRSGVEPLDPLGPLDRFED